MPRRFLAITWLLLAAAFPGACASVELPRRHQTVVFVPASAPPASTASLRPMEIAIDLTAIRTQPRRWVIQTPTVETSSAPGYSEALVSWNITLVPGAAASVDLSVNETTGVAWSPALRVGSVGDDRMLDAPVFSYHTMSGTLARIDTDYFTSSDVFRGGRITVTLIAPEAWTSDQPPGRVDRLSICLTCTRDLRRVNPADLAGPLKGVTAENAVPFRSQKTDRPELSGRLCSPTSLAMVLAHFGVDRPVQEVAQTVRDPAHDIYGNWPRNIQGAFQLGVPGFLTRFNDWESVAWHLRRGEPVIASIRAPRGVLHNAPYTELDTGHLIVLTGLDGRGGVRVNDPAAGTPERGRRVYSMKELSKAWMELGKGTAYVLLAPVAATDAKTGDRHD